MFSVLYLVNCDHYCNSIFMSVPIRYYYKVINDMKIMVLFLAKRGRRPRVAGFIILSLKGLRRDEISCAVYGHVYLFIYLFIYL